MKYKLWIAMAAVMAALLLTANVALASVTFDPSTGTGFVGKGDVQLAFGWNNAVAQGQATNVSFSYNATNSYDVVIDFDSGGIHNTTHHTVTQNKSTSVNDSVSYDARQRNQYTGWNLTGFGTTSTSGDTIPNPGDSCPNGDLGTCVVTAVTLTSSTGGLYVSDTALSLGPVKIG